MLQTPSLLTLSWLLTLVIDASLAIVIDASLATDSHTVTNDTFWATDTIIINTSLAADTVTMDTHFISIPKKALSPIFPIHLCLVGFVVVVIVFNWFLLASADHSRVNKACQNIHSPSTPPPPPSPCKYCK